MPGTWLASAASGTTADLVALRPDLGVLLDEFDGQARAGVSARVRQLMQARVEQLIGAAPSVSALIGEQARSWPTHPDVSEMERAVLGLTESFVIDIHSVTDEQVVALQGLIGDDGVMAVLMNLAILDGLAKMRRVFAA